MDLFKCALTTIVAGFVLAGAASASTIYGAHNATSHQIGTQMTNLVVENTKGF